MGSAVPSEVNRSIYALHGFLGSAQDWTTTFEGLPYSVTAPNYFSDEAFAKFNLDAFIVNIQQSLNTPISNSTQKNSATRKIDEARVFIGYSLGGRIGLQILEKAPQLFDHYVFISTHSGLKSAQDKEQRLASDQKWIDRLQNSPWSDFISLWNQQDVLKNSSSAFLPESAYKKDRLIKALSDFSLGHQKDYSELIQKHQNKITWITGAQDQKFSNLADELKQKKILLHDKRIFSGHRILLDHPKDLQAQLVPVLEQLPQ